MHAPQHFRGVPAQTDRAIDDVLAGMWLECVEDFIQQDRDVPDVALHRADRGASSSGLSGGLE